MGNRKIHRYAYLGGLFALGFLLLTSSAQAQNTETTYVYVGPQFNWAGGHPASFSSNLTGYIKLSKPIPPNLVQFGPCCGTELEEYGRLSVESFSFTANGFGTVTDQTPCGSGTVGDCSQFRVNTDANGKIVEWWIDVDEIETSSMDIQKQGLCLC